MEGFLYDEFYKIEKTHWWFVGMRSIFHLMFQQASGGRKDLRLVDVGCGTGMVLQEFGRYGDICGLDLAPQAVEYTKRRDPANAAVQANILALPISTQSVDVVLALDVIEHIEDDEAALREIQRILCPGGFVLINVPAFASLWSEKDTANHHHRRYTSRMLRQVLGATGFVIERITYTNSLLFPAIWLTRQMQNLFGARWDPDAEYHPTNLANRLLLQTMFLEKNILKVANFPAGTSVTCVARRHS